MCKDRIVFLVAGCMVSGGIALGHFIHPGFLFISLFPGVMMITAALTGFCPLTKILNALKVERCTTGSPLD